jgi:cellulose synthase operon protein C
MGLRPFLFVWLMCPCVLIASQTIAARPGIAKKELAVGMAAFKKGDVQTANIHLLNAVKADPANGLVQAIFGRVQLSIGRVEQAQNAFDSALRHGIAPTRISHLRGEAALEQGDAATALDLTDPAKVAPAFRAYALRVRANALSASGDFDGAGRTFDAAFAAGPESPDLWTDVGRFRIATGNISGAIEAALKANKLDGRHVGSLILMGELARNQYGLEASLPWFERALRVDRYNLRALEELAATYGDAGRNRDMLATSRRLLLVDMNNPKAYYFQAILAARANMPDIARSLLYRIGDRMGNPPALMLLRGILEIQAGADEQAARELAPLVELQSSNDKARRLLGAALLRTKDYSRGIEILLPLVSRDDADSYSLALIGRAYEAKGDRMAAATYLDRAAAIQTGKPTPFAFTVPDNITDPNNPAVAIPEISRLIESDRALDALTRARFLQSRNPGAPDPIVLVGDSLTALGRHREASLAYRDAANIRFSEAIALRFVRSLIDAGDNPGALTVLNLFLAQNPRNVAARMVSSEVAISAGDWPKAIMILEGLRSQLGNRDAVLLVHLATAYLENGDQKRALGFARAAYDLAPSNPVAANIYGATLFRSGRSATKGIALMEKAVAIDRTNADYRFELAQAYAGIGRKADAKRELSAAIAAPDFQDQKEAKALLNRL